MLGKSGRLGAASYRRLHFLQAGAGHSQRVLTPVIAVKKLQGKESSVADGPQVAEDVLQGGDAVAGIDPSGIGDGGAGRGSRIIVAVDHAQERSRNEFQAMEIRAAFLA